RRRTRLSFEPRQTRHRPRREPALALWRISHGRRRACRVRRKTGTPFGLDQRRIFLLPSVVRPISVARRGLRARTRAVVEAGSRRPAGGVSAPALLGVHGHAARPRIPDRIVGVGERSVVPNLQTPPIPSPANGGGLGWG